jgi:hypothetical protein
MRMSMARAAFGCVSLIVIFSFGCSSDTNSTASPGGDAGLTEAASSSEVGAIDMPTMMDGPMPDCSDGVRNGDESDVDCGGFCSPCAIGKTCKAHSDCESVHCIDGKCQVCAPGSNQCAGNKPSTCMNGMWMVAADDCPSGCDLNTGMCVTGSE